MLAFVAAVVVGGTGAYFSDTETSQNNVFTAGSVSLALNEYNWEWLGTVADGEALPDNYFVYHSNSGDEDNGPYIEMNDLKPGDNGLITAELENGANDAFICAKITDFEEDDPFKDHLKFRTGTGPGGSFADITSAVPTGVWFSPTAPAANMPALPMPANATGTVALEYCFGDFVQGTAFGTANNGSCEVNTDGSIDWNVMQNQSLSVSIEYYAVQQRNNEDFTCLGMNEINVVQSSGQNFSAGGWAGWSCPTGEIAVGGRILDSDGDVMDENDIIAQGLAVPGETVGGSTYPNYPHHNFTYPETGYVVQSGVATNGSIIEVDCLVPPAN